MSFLPDEGLGTPTSSSAAMAFAFQELSTPSTVEGSEIQTSYLSYGPA